MTDRKTSTGAHHPRGRSKRWVFTLHNPKDRGCVELDMHDVDIVFWQSELSQGAMREHLQGAVQFTATKSLAQVRAMMPKAHWEAMLGTLEQAVWYCTKKRTRVAGPWAIIHGDSPDAKAWSQLMSTQQALKRPFSC